MSNENLDQDALATEEMLKMFEGIEVDDAQVSAETEASELLDSLSLEDDITEIMDDEIASEDELESLATMDLAATADAELLEIADNDETTQLLEGLDSLEANDELAGLSFDEDTNEHFTQSNDDEFPVAELADVSSISEADTLEVDDLVMNETNPDEMTPATLTTTPSSAISLNDTTLIAEHLQAVVANAIQALQDWMQLRQEGEHKGPQQSLAQLDVLLDTVTNQQQQLAEQLANSPQKQLTQISSALGETLATPQTLGWTDEDWRIKAQQVAYKTDDISQRNAKIRQELTRL